MLLFLTYFYFSFKNHELPDLNLCGPTTVVNFDNANEVLQIYSSEQVVHRLASLLNVSIQCMQNMKFINIHDELTTPQNDTFENQYVSRLYTFICTYRMICLMIK